MLVFTLFALQRYMWGAEMEMLKSASYIFFPPLRSSTSIQSNIDPVLHYKPPAVHRPLLFRFAKLQIVVHEQRWD